METTAKTTLKQLLDAYTLHDKQAFIDVCNDNAQLTSDHEGNYTLRTCGVRIPADSFTIAMMLGCVLENSDRDRAIELLDWIGLPLKEKLQTGIYTFADWHELVESLYIRYEPFVTRELLWRKAKDIINKLQKSINHSEALITLPRTLSALQIVEDEYDMRQLIKSTMLLTYEGCTEGLYVYGADITVKITNEDIAKYLCLRYDLVRDNIVDIYAEHEQAVDAHFLFEAREEIINALERNIKAIEAGD